MAALLFTVPCLLLTDIYFYQSGLGIARCISFKAGLSTELLCSKKNHTPCLGFPSVDKPPGVHPLSTEELLLLNQLIGDKVDTLLCFL